MLDRVEQDAGHSGQPEDTPALRELYRGFEQNHLLPLWTQLGDLMPMHPKPRSDAARANGQVIALAEVRRTGPGRTGRRTPRHRTRQSRPWRQRLCDADLVGCHPVPRPA